MDVLEAIQARHAVRDFDCDPVLEDILKKILAAAMRSPRRPIEEVVRFKN